MYNCWYRDSHFDGNKKHFVSANIFHAHLVWGAWKSVAMRETAWSRQTKQSQNSAVITYHNMVVSDL